MNKFTRFTLLMVLGGFLVAQESVDSSVSLSASGSPVLHLTIDDALWLATAHNEEFHFENRRQSLLMRKERHFIGNFFPRFGVDGSLGIREDVSFVRSEDTFYRLTSSLGLYLRWDIFDYTLYTGWQRVKIDSAQGKINQKILSQKLKQSIRQKFYALLLQREEIKFQKSKVSSLESTYLDNVAKHDRGLIDWVELIKSQTEWEIEVPNTEKLELDFQQNKKRFMLDLSLPMETEIELLGSFETLLVAVQDTIEKGGYLARTDLVEKNTSLATQRNTLNYHKTDELQKKIEYAPKLSLDLRSAYPLLGFDKYQNREPWNTVTAQKLWLSGSLVLTWQLSDYLWYSAWEQDRALKTLEREEAEEAYRKGLVTQNFERESLIDKIGNKKKELAQRSTLLEINTLRLEEAHLLFDGGTVSYDAVLNAVKVKEEASFAYAKGQVELLLLYQDLIMMY